MGYHSYTTILTESVINSFNGDVIKEGEVVICTPVLVPKKNRKDIDKKEFVHTYQTEDGRIIKNYWKQIHQIIPENLTKLYN